MIKSQVNILLYSAMQCILTSMPPFDILSIFFIELIVLTYTHNIIITLHNFAATDAIHRIISKQNKPKHKR
jgi:hypothetical protein